MTETELRDKHGFQFEKTMNGYRWRVETPTGMHETGFRSRHSNANETSERRQAVAEAIKMLGCE